MQVQWADATESSVMRRPVAAAAARQSRNLWPAWPSGAVQCPCYIFSSIGVAAAAAIDFMTLECNIGGSITRSRGGRGGRDRSFFVVLYV